MPTYDLDIEPARRGAKAGRIGCAVAGWVTFAVLFAGAAFFGYRVWTYYGRISRGEIVDLPQFRSRLSAVASASSSPAVAASRAEVESGDHPAEGPASDAAEVTVVQFADFQCPFSKEEATVVRTLMRKYGDRVRFIYRDYPIDALHPDATQAAMAAECAREQGRFWAYHDKLFANSPALGFQDLSRYAEEVGLDKTQFERCLAEDRYRAKVEEDRALAERLRLPGTPTFFLNGQRVDGAIPADAFEQLLERLLP